MKIIATHWKGLLSLLFGVLVALFWALGARELINYQEQYQMFLFTPDYFWQRFTTPGGLVDWIAEFLTQFNYHYVAGSVILGLLFMLMQILTARLCARHGLADRWYALTFVPAILLLAYMGNADVMPSFLIALIVLEGLMLGWDKVQGLKRGTRAVILTIALIFAYDFFGAVSLSFGLYVIVYEWTRKDEYTPTKTIFSASVVFLIALMIYEVVQNTPYPLYRILGGLNYFRYPTAIPKMQIVLMILIPLWPLLGNGLSNASSKQSFRTKLVGLTTWVVVVLGGAAWVHVSFDTLANKLIEYDFLVRTQSWDKLINKGLKAAATGEEMTPLEVSCINLALSQKGELCDRLFEFYQNGGQGLFPNFTRDMLSPVSTAELFYSIGMVNDCERFMFEAQQAIPNFRRSGRLSRRIIECEVINGHYAVARKLLHELQHTLFYKAWAKQMLATLDSPKREEIINSNPVYGQLRRWQVTKDFLFSDREMDQMLGLLYTHDHTNRNAYEYLMAYELLQIDMPRFMQYYALGQYAGYTDHIPYAIQQGLLYDWTRRHNSFQGMPYSIDPQWQQAMGRFIEIYMRDKHDPALSQPPLGTTFWSYMLVKTQQRQKKEKSQPIY